MASSADNSNCDADISLDGNGGMLHDNLNPPNYYVNLGRWLRRIREAWDTAVTATPGVLKSRWFIFISGMIIYHLGKRAFETVQKGDLEILTGLMWAIWDMLSSLFRLFQQHEDVIYQWSEMIHSFCLCSILTTAAG